MYKYYTFIVALLTTMVVLADDTITPPDIDTLAPVPIDTTIATLVRVTSADEMRVGGQYVFCRNGRVLTESSSSPTPTTDLWRTDSLTGKEQYVWTLTLAIGQHFVVGGQYNLYLGNPKGSDLKCETGITAYWGFDFAEDSTATILSNNNRFIGEKTAFSGQYIAPSKSLLSAYPHDFIIYRLEFPKLPEPEEPEEPETTAVSSPSAQEGEQGRRFIHESQVLIETHGHTYTLTGQQLH